MNGLLSNKLMSNMLLIGDTGLSRLYTNGYEDIAWIEGYSSGTGTQSKNTDHLYLKGGTYDFGADERSYVTDSKVSLANISTLYVDWENTGVNTANHMAYVVLEVHNAKTEGYGSGVTRISVNLPFSRRIDSLDVSTLEGEYYMAIHAYRRGELKAYKVWGEE